jgi:pimeloyl-ACP methyl ester carboxylesterase
MALGVLLAVVAGCVAGWGDRATLVAAGGDPSEGVLINVTPGARPFDPPDRSLPTLVFIHGFNPLPGAVHFTMAERLGEVVGRRAGPRFNVLGWDWNAATFPRSLDPNAGPEAAVHQGRLLAATLRSAGVDPSRTHLIGHSAGGIVAASAARTFATDLGQPVAQLTLLDPAAYYHSVIFDRLAAGSAAPIVENYWATGPSGYGRIVPYAGVRNIGVAGPSPYVGLVFPLRSNHLFVVQWYLDTAESPFYPSGFNTSVLLRARVASAR